MKRNTININLDKVEFCYTAPIQTIKDLEDTKYKEFDGFRISSIESDNNLESLLQVDVLYSINDKELDWMKYAVLKIGSTFEDKDNPIRYVWMKIDNKALYTEFYPSSSILHFVYNITENLGLSFNNITKLDIAADVTYNTFFRIRRAIRNMELTPIILGKAYEKPNEVIDKVLYIHTADRIRYRTNTISISTKEKDMSLCIYNKSEEIKCNSKEYIAKWDGTDADIYRNEVRLKRTSIIDFLDKKGISFEDLYYMIHDMNLLFEMFLFFSNRIIRFRRGKDILSILEL